MIVPTRRFWLLVGLGLPVALLGAWLPGVERVLIPYNVALFLLLLATSRWAPRGDALRVARRHDQVLSSRAQNLVTLEVVNEGGQSATGRIRDEAPAGFEADRQEWRLDLAPGERKEFRYHVRPLQRGSAFFRGTFVRLAAPLGLAEVQYRLRTEKPVRVYPNVLALREFDLLAQKGRLNLIGIRRSRRKGLGTDFESLRDYHDDDFRRIDWKTTARRGKLVVREYEVERNQGVILCVDTSRAMLAEVAGTTKLDHTLDAMLMLMRAASVAGDQVGLLVFGAQVERYVPPRRGAAQTGAILEAVHALGAEPSYPAYARAFGYLSSRWKRRSLLVVFSDVDDDEQARELMQALTPQTRRHLVVLVRVADPRLRRLCRQPLSGPKAFYEAAAAEWHANERAKAGRHLVSGNVRVIEAEPEELAATLVSAYLGIKEAGAL
jgi:uncharacterized protein (DUF58 family)